MLRQTFYQLSYNPPSPNYLAIFGNRVSLYVALASLEPTMKARLAFKLGSVLIPQPPCCWDIRTQPHFIYVVPG